MTLGASDLRSSITVSEGRRRASASASVSIPELHVLLCGPGAATCSVTSFCLRPGFRGERRRMAAVRRDRDTHLVKPSSEDKWTPP